MNENITSALKDWIPYRLQEDGYDYNCRWLYLGEEEIKEPFFNDTIAKCRKIFNNSQLRRCVSSLDILPEWADQIDSLSPAAFIFHVSRCGSTLISQLFGLNSSIIVLSEVPFFDELLRWGNKHNRKEAISLLKAAVQLYGAKRKNTDGHLIIKTDSWHIHFYAQLRQLYPQIPFILLYRQPDEVIRSQQKNRGMQAVPGVVEPEIFGFDINEITKIGLDEYMAKVLEGYFQQFIDILKSDKLSFPVNYNEGALPIVKKIAAVSGISISEDEMELMNQRSGFHAKYPDQLFTETAMSQPVPAYLENAFALYDELEKIRNN
jgi:hypothetical protein